MKAGLQQLRAGGFDVVISDENLEGESGSSMLRQASAEGLLCNVGAMMYTAEARKLDVPVGVVVLRKPLGISAMLHEAQAIAPESSDAPPRSSGMRAIADFVEGPPSSRAVR